MSQKFVTGVRKDENATRQLRRSSATEPSSTNRSPVYAGSNGESGERGCNPEPNAACVGASPVTQKLSPTGWKREFQDGETLIIKGIGFVLVKVTKRGLALRRVRKEKQP